MGVVWDIHGRYRGVAIVECKSERAIRRQGECTQILCMLICMIRQSPTRRYILLQPCAFCFKAQYSQEAAWRLFLTPVQVSRSRSLDFTESAEWRIDKASTKVYEREKGHALMQQNNGKIGWPESDGAKHAAYTVWQGKGCRASAELLAHLLLSVYICYANKEVFWWLYVARES